MSNYDVTYAKKYNCTIAEAIADRDEPQTRHDLKMRYYKATGQFPSEDEMAVMRPDHVEVVRAFILDNDEGDL